LSSRLWRPESRRRALAFGGALVLPALVLGLGVALVAFWATGERPVVLSPRTALERLGEDWLALPFWTGFRGLVFSPGKSLFLYSPWLLLALPGAVVFLRRWGTSGAVIVAFPLLMVALYSKKLVWHGGSWGPRYMLPIVPFLCLAALPAVEWCLARGRASRLALAGLFAVSLCVQIVAIGKDPEQYPSMVREGVVPKLPGYGSAFGGRDYWQARGGEGIERALRNPDPGATDRGLGYLWGYPTAEMTIGVRESRRFDLSLYFVDWDRRARREVVTIDDAAGRRTFTLDRDFGDGIWATWQVQATPDAPIRIGLQQTGSDTAVLSAVAFDAPRGERRDQPALDERVRGNWLGTYGTDGYVLLAWRSFNVDVASLPSYVLLYDVSHVGDKPDPRIHVEIAEQDLRDTPLLYAAPFSPLLGNVWLLAADAAHLLFPARPGIEAGILARPPWTWFGIGAPKPPHPEYGLGLDFWPALLYANYASQTGVLVVMWVALLAMEAAVVATAVRLGSVWLRGRALAVLLVGVCLALAAFDWLQVQA
jgi:hypothetical protein